MTFPTKADIEFFKEAKRIQRGWEPKAWDATYLPMSEEVHVVQALDQMGGHRLVQLGHLWFPADEVIFLPRQGQLQEMLEERGYLWDVGIKAVYGTQDKYRACAFTEKEVAVFLIHTGQSWSPLNAKIIWVGPTPSIALGKCLLEVLKGGE